MKRFGLFLLGILYLGALGLYLHFIGLEGDTGHLIDQTRGSLECMRHGQWIGCTAGGSFPLLQKIPALGLVALVWKNGLVTRLLVALNIVASVILALLGFNSLRRRSEGSAWGFLLVLIVGPYLWYARSSFSEALAAFFTLAFIVSLRDGWKRSLSFIFLVLAALSKETAFPFLILLGGLAAFLRASEVPKKVSTGFWAEALVIFLGCAVGTGLNFAHNFFKFGTWVNQVYADPINFVPDFATQTNFFLALLFAPNGGLLVFWPVFVGLLLWSFSRRVVVPGGVLLALLGMTVGFSKWAYPFGWLSWGPRFYMPWIPSMAYLLLSSDAQQFDVSLRRVMGSMRSFAVLCVASVVLLFSHAVAWFTPRLIDSLFMADAVCPQDPVIQVDKALYLRCIRYFAWDKTPLILRAFNPLFEPLAFFFAVVACVALVHILIQLRKRLCARAVPAV